MRSSDGLLSFSPSDVTAYLECEHLTQLELKVAHGELVRPHVEDAQAELIRRKGEEHEAAYLEQIRRLQGRLPERMHIALGSGETESYRVLDFLAYYRRVRGRFLDAVYHPRLTEPWPVEHCGICDFLPLCNAWWDEHDHLTRVANIRRDQIVRLGGAGVTTLPALGDAPPETPRPRL